MCSKTSFELVSIALLKSFDRRASFAISSIENKRRKIYLMMYSSNCKIGISKIGSGHLLLKVLSNLLMQQYHANAFGRKAGLGTELLSCSGVNTSLSRDDGV